MLNFGIDWVMVYDGLRIGVNVQNDRLMLYSVDFWNHKWKMGLKKGGDIERDLDRICMTIHVIIIILIDYFKALHLKSKRICYFYLAKEALEK